jgi:hypothetical protein
MKLIDKDALVAEIKKLIRKNELHLDDNVSDAARYQKVGAYSVLNDLLHFLDTLEVKEVDLEKEIDECMKQYHMIAVGRRDFSKIAKHFIELGLNAKVE